MPLPPYVPEIGVRAPWLTLAEGKEARIDVDLVLQYANPNAADVPGHEQAIEEIRGVIARADAWGLEQPHRNWELYTSTSLDELRRLVAYGRKFIDPNAPDVGPEAALIGQTITAPADSGIKPRFKEAADKGLGIWLNAQDVVAVNELLSQLEPVTPAADES